MFTILNLGCLCCSAKDKSNEVDLIIVAGQSNAVGFDTNPDKLPPNDSDKEVLFWWRCGEPPVDKYDTTSKSKWTTMKIQHQADRLADKKNSRKSRNFRHTTGGFGPEIGLSRTLLELQPKKKLAVLKVAYSSTSVTQWNSSRSNKESCYSALIAETKSAIKSAKKKGLTIRLRAFVWIQGESDSRGDRPAQYEARLGSMLKALRDDLDTKDMIMLLGLNTKFGGGKAGVQTVIQAQKNLAEQSKYIEYVDSTGCAVINGAHFSSQGTLELGNRFAKRLIDVEMEIKK